jgi:hypothetical protein
MSFNLRIAAIGMAGLLPTLIYMVPDLNNNRCHHLEIAHFLPTGINTCGSYRDGNCNKSETSSS